MKKEIESDQGKQKTKKLPANLDTDRGMLLPGPFAVTDGDRCSSDRELSKSLSGKK